MARSDDRRDFTVDTKIRLLERDADMQEDATHHTNERLDGMQRVMIGILAATASSAVLLAINIAVQAAGGK